MNLFPKYIKLLSQISNTKKMFICIILLICKNTEIHTKKKRNHWWKRKHGTLYKFINYINEVFKIKKMFVYILNKKEKGKTITTNYKETGCAFIFSLISFWLVCSLIENSPNFYQTSCAPTKRSSVLQRFEPALTL